MLSDTRRRFVWHWIGLALIAMIAVCSWWLFRDVGLRPATKQFAVFNIESFDSQVNRDGAIGLVRHLDERRVAAGQETYMGESQVRIVDGAGVRVSGAEVRVLKDVVVYCDFDYSFFPLVQSAPSMVSDDLGIVDTSVIRPNQELVVSQTGYMPTLFVSGIRLNSTRDVVLRRQGDSRIVVKGVDGLPLTDARILVEASDWGWPFRGRGQYFELGRTNGLGSLQFSVGSPSCRAIISAEGYSLLPFNLGDSLGILEDLVYTLPKASVVAGTVSGAIFEGPMVVVAEMLSSLDQPSISAPVASGQSFTLPPLIDGVDWTLTPCILSKGLPQAVGASVVIRPPVNQVSLAVERGLGISLLAVDSGGSPVLAGVKISLSSSSFLAHPRQDSVSVDSEGAMHWRSLPCPRPLESGNAKHEIWICADGFDPLFAGHHELKQGGQVDLGKVALESAVQWNVEVSGIDDGPPIQDARVAFAPGLMITAANKKRFYRQVAFTDENGNATLISFGQLGGILDVSASGWVSQRIELSDSSFPDQEIELERPASVLLECLSVEGDSQPRAAIQWQSIVGLGGERDSWNALNAGNDGRVRFDVPAGDIRVRHAPGTLRGVSSGGSMIAIDLNGEQEGKMPFSDSVELIAIQAGELRIATLTLETLSSIDVSVYVDGKPSSGDQIVAIPGSLLDVVDNDIWGSFSLPRAIADANGRCTLRGLPLGRMTLARIDPSSRIVTFMVLIVRRPLSSPVNYSFATREITCLLESAHGEPLGGVRVDLKQLSVQQGVRSPMITRKTPGGARRIDSSPLRGMSGISDSNGHVVFSGIPIKAKFSLSCLDQVTYPLFPIVVVPPGHDDVRVKLTNGQAAAIELELRDRHDIAQSNVTVVLRWTDGDGQERDRFAESDVQGVVRFSGLEPRGYRVLFSGYGESLDVELVPGALFSQLQILR